MRNLTLIICFLMMAACDTESRRKHELLQAKLEKLRIAADFKPLPEAEAYDLINRYYLPHLDTLPYKRKIFIHPITGKDFRAVFKRDSLALVQPGSTKKKVEEVIMPPPPAFYDTTYSWKVNLLKKVRLMSGSELIDIGTGGKDLSQRLALWRKRFCMGYVSISYPLYNAHNKQVFFQEWIEDGGWCGTGREQRFLFEKIQGGWRKL